MKQEQFGQEAARDVAGKEKTKVNGKAQKTRLILGIINTKIKI